MLCFVSAVLNVTPLGFAASGGIGGGFATVFRNCLRASRSGNLKLLKPRRKFCLVGLPAVSSPLKFEPFDIVGEELEIVGGKIGGTEVMRQMLAFSAQHKCFPQCEQVDFKDAQVGIAKMHDNSARYRTVLKIEGFRDAQA